MNRDVMFLTWPGHDFARDALRGLMQWHESLGDSCRFSNYRLKPHEWHEHYRYPDLAYVWNGEYGEVQRNLQFLKDRGTRLKYVEIAWFPQHEYIYVDDKGTNGHCSLLGSSLEWLKPEHFDEVQRLRETHLNNAVWHGKGGYIAVPLQLAQDTQVSKFSPRIKDMRYMMDHCEMVFPHDKLMFKKHPKDKSTLGPRCFTGGNLHEWLAGAKLVYGINSTVLLEAALMGAPTVAIGTSLLHIDPDQERSLAALAAKQIPVGLNELGPWTEHPDLGLAL